MDGSSIQSQLLLQTTSGLSDTTAERSCASLRSRTSLGILSQEIDILVAVIPDNRCSVRRILFVCGLCAFACVLLYGLLYVLVVYLCLCLTCSFPMCIPF